MVSKKICNMSKKKEKKPSGYWTFENVKKESEKYNTKTEFRINSSEAYYSARYHKWYEDVTKHMVQVTKPSGYWTYERVKEEAKKYEFCPGLLGELEMVDKIMKGENLSDIIYNPNL